MFTSISPAMSKVDDIVERVAPTDLSVLITGESGVGKEVVARKIHSESPRDDRIFAKINSAAIPDTLFESELFGHQKGAFTGANSDRDGRLVAAHQGTLFFDEIAELTPQLQTKLLHIIQDKVFTPLGCNGSVGVDVRILAATNRDLLDAIRRGDFREDLYYRLNVVHINVPPLRRCEADIRGLADYFLVKYSREFKKSDEPTLTEGQYECMRMYDWPGNVRELENFVKKLCLFDDSRAVFDDLRKRTRERKNSLDHKPSLLEVARMVEEEVDRKIIAQVLRRNGWNRKKTAKTLQISYRSLLSKIKKLQID